MATSATRAPEFSGRIVKLRVNSAACIVTLSTDTASHSLHTTHSNYNAMLSTLLLAASKDLEIKISVPENGIQDIWVTVK